MNALQPFLMFRYWKEDLVKLNVQRGELIPHASDNLGNGEDPSLRRPAEAGPAYVAKNGHSQ